MKNLDKNLIKKTLKHFDKSLDVQNYREYEKGRARTTIEVSTQKKDLIIYYCTNPDSRERFRKEEKLLEKVEENTCIPVPEIYYSDLSEDEIPYMYYIAEKVNGFNPDDSVDSFSASQWEETLESTAVQMSDLHKNLEMDGFGSIIYRDGKLSFSHDSWYGFLQDWVEPFLDELDNSRFKDLKEDIEAFIEENRRLSNMDKPACVHFDFKPDNQIVKVKTSKELNRKADKVKKRKKVVKHLKKGKDIRTAYLEDGRWVEGDKLKIHNNKWLTTEGTKEERDNLGNLQSF